MPTYQNVVPPISIAQGDTASLMKTCQAFYPIAGTHSSWIPCVRKAEKGSHFCRRHGDAGFGPLLGALFYADPQCSAGHSCQLHSVSPTPRFLFALS